MKVLLIGPLPNPIDGCSLSNFTLCKNLDENHIAYEAINTNVKSVSSKQGSSFSLKKSFIFFKVYLKVFRVLHAKVVYLTPGQTFFGVLKYSPFILLCQWCRIPYIIHVHGNHLGKEYDSLIGFKKNVFYKLISKASAGIVLSKSLRNNFKGLLSEENIYEVENFANDELYSSYRPNLKNKEKLTILFLSNLIAEKGVLDFLDALKMLKNKNIEYKAYLAGKMEDEYKEILCDKIKYLGHQVEYLGVIRGEIKNKYLNESNVFVLPTYYKMEGQPISILEAMAMGNIVITTEHAGILDVFSSNNGYFVNKKSPEEIALVLQTISKNLKDHINKISSINRSYAESKFTEEIFSNKIIKILEKVAQN